MKKLMFGLLATGFMTLLSFTTAPVAKETKKETVKMTYYSVRCNGVLAGYFACDGCNAQAVGNAMCNG
ncbi:hypothetical protein [Flavobacterium sp.]|uniref:hypothetical protein n=2 Tax=Flavobacterium sp. TaxID=239 RepID=UPI00375302CF